MATAEAQKLAAVARALPSVCTKDATLYQDYQAGIHVLIPYQHFASFCNILFFDTSDAKLPQCWPKEEQDIFPRAIELVLAKHLPPDGQPSVLGTECCEC